MKNQKRLLGWICAGVLAIASAPGALGQTKTGKHVKVPVVPARPEDVSSPERIDRVDFDWGGRRARREYLSGILRPQAVVAFVGFLGCGTCHQRDS
jgi:hypothetical protein